MVRENLLEMISRKEIDEEKESYPQNAEMHGTWLIWENCTGTLAVASESPEEEDAEARMLKKMSEIELAPETWKGWVKKR